MIFSRTVLLEDICKKFSSKKFSLSFPFFNRNKQCIKLKAVDQKSFVEIVEDNSLVVSEPNLRNCSCRMIKEISGKNFIEFFGKIQF